MGVFGGVKAARFLEPGFVKQHFSPAKRLLALNYSKITAHLKGLDHIYRKDQEQRLLMQKKNVPRKKGASRKESSQNNALLLIGSLTIVVVAIVVIVLVLTRQNAPASSVGSGSNSNVNSANTTNNTRIANAPTQPIHIPTASSGSVPNVPAVTKNEQWTPQRQSIGGR